MYYEAREHKTRPVASAAEAAAIIVGWQAAIYDALTWTAETGRQLCAVADGHIDSPWSEVAVVRLDGERPVQVESITFAWLSGDEDQRVAAGTDHLERCETTDFSMGPTAFPLDGSGEDRLAWFSCGCCGTSFRSTLSKQRIFDQDAGYGICQDCERYYHR